jgi:hypothetical protein
MRRILPLLALPLLLAACSEEKSAGFAAADGNTRAMSAPSARSTAEAPAAPGLEQGTDDAAATADTSSGPPTKPGTDSVIPQMLIREGTATVRVDKLEPAIAKVEQLAKRLGGYVADQSMQSGSQNTREATLELKVPATRWQQALSGLDPVGKVESQQSTAQDVGEEFVDVTARMNNARQLEQRLLTLLDTRTGKLDDVLSVERELARVREEIERYEGRLRYLRTRAAMSTLTVTLHEPYPVLGAGNSPILSAFAQAWRNFVGFTAGFIAALGWLIPLLVVLAAFVWLLRWLWRKTGLRRTRVPPQTPPPGPPPPAAGPGPQA